MTSQHRDGVLLLSAIHWQGLVICMQKLECDHGFSGGVGSSKLMSETGTLRPSCQGLRHTLVQEKVHELMYCLLPDNLEAPLPWIEVLGHIWHHFGRLQSWMVA